MTSRNYDIKTLQDYLAGKLDAKAMHALERQALEDPVLADALGGLMSNPSLTTENFDEGMDRLSGRLDKRIKADLQNKDSTARSKDNDVENADNAGTGVLNRVLPLTNESVTNEAVKSETTHTPEATLYQKTQKTKIVIGRTWWRVAAILVVLLVGAWFYFGIRGKHGQSGTSSDRQLALNGADTVISNQSLPGASSNEIASAINKVLVDSIAAKNNGQSAPDALAKANRIKEGNKADIQSKYGQHKMAMGKNPVKVQKDLHPITPNSDVTVMAKRDTRMQREMLSAATMVAENNLPAEVIMDTTADTKRQVTTLAPTAKALVDLLPPQANIKPMLAGKAGQTDIHIRGAEASKQRIPSDSTNPLSEVVVVGYGKRHKTRITGAVKKHVNTKSPKIVLMDPKAYQDSVGIDLRVAQKAVQENADVVSELQGKVAGVNVKPAANRGSSMKVHVSRISGHLEPINGFKGLRKYLEKNLKKDIHEGRIALWDTGKVYFEVSVEKTNKMETVQITHVTSSQIAVKDWFIRISKKTAGWPDWQVEKGYSRIEVAGPTKVVIELYNKSN